MAEGEFEYEQLDKEAMVTQINAKIASLESDYFNYAMEVQEAPQLAQLMRNIESKISNLKAMRQGLES